MWYIFKSTITLNGEIKLEYKGERIDAEMGKFAAKQMIYSGEVYYVWCSENGRAYQIISSGGRQTVKVVRIDPSIIPEQYK